MTHIESLKSKKREGAILLGSACSYNHPHRLAAVGLSGSVSLTVDTRAFDPAPISSASLTVYTLNFSTLATWIRVYAPELPQLIGTSEPVALAAAEFNLWHSPKYFWQFYTSFGTNPDYLKIGTKKTTPYSKSGGSWIAGTPVTTDVLCRFSFDITGGGTAVGGKDDTVDSTKATISPSILMINAPDIPGFSQDVMRFPWDDPWAAETAAFSTIFTDHIAARNTADGGGWSGSCSLSLDFT